ncbi:hypothetical protein PNO30_05420 [Gemella haemolysans]|uniref:Uncharacterized protein n=1 Tax=Gemella haemolysans TaxID=1379 RepID=A0AAW6B393_9BACL|nr:hypothetical protein [Gemella haemolysans]MDB6186224.1 hypothetical protein [Gemella haemolysans]MDU4714511.1 hypothetical protein [Gemella haemolysans]
MRKSYLRGTWLTLFFAILFVLMSIGGIQSLYDDRTKSAEVQYKEGKQFQKSSGYTFIKVEALEELDIKDDSLKDNQKFYMLQHEHGFVMLKASKEDVKKLIQSNDIPNEKLIDLKDKNIYSRVNAIFERESKWEKLNISPELKEKFENAAEHSLIFRESVSDNQSSKLQEKPFLSNYYLAVPVKGSDIGAYAMEVVFLLIPFFLIKSVIKNIRKNKAEYEELFIEYPETERDLDILVREAKYINKKLKVLIYKDALIIYGRGFNFQLLSGFSKVTFDREIRKGRGISYIAYFHNNFETDEKVKVCSNYKNLREDIDELGKTLKETFGKTVRYNF